jgi:hypothetical protein
VAGGCVHGEYFIIVLVLLVTSLSLNGLHSTDRSLFYVKGWVLGLAMVVQSEEFIVVRIVDSRLLLRKQCEFVRLKCFLLVLLEIFEGLAGRLLFKGLIPDRFWLQRNSLTRVWVSVMVNLDDLNLSFEGLLNVDEVLPGLAQRSFVAVIRDFQDLGVFVRRVRDG